jgi:hypothetical protein
MPVHHSAGEGSGNHSTAAAKDAAAQLATDPSLWGQQLAPEVDARRQAATEPAELPN